MVFSRDYTLFMKNFVLDAWAIMALIQREEPAASQVKQLFQENDITFFFSMINLGEVYYTIARRKGIVVANNDIRFVEQLPIEFIVPNRHRILEAARLKSQHKISYADAFAAATALEFDAVLLTGDPELIALRAIVKIQSLYRQ